MTVVRPNMVECWVFRVPEPGRIELLLIRRAGHRIFPGLWQCVTGGLQPGERVPMTALREVGEETGIPPEAYEAFFDLDQTSQFYDEGFDGVITAVVFALRVRPDAEPSLSDEHDAFRWAEPEEALRRAVWPLYRESIERIRGRLLDPEQARWFELDLEGRRIARRPTADGSEPTGVSM
jgi:dATP pyrophosphohydrolase